MYLILILVILYIIYAIIPTYYYKLKTIITRKKSKFLYLTFDDGPSKYTMELLDVLKEYNIPATFFVVASFAISNKNIIKRMKAENHEIGMHSLNHNCAYFMGPSMVKNDFQKCKEIAQKLDINVVYFRPPWGVLNLASIYQIRRHKLKIILWNVMAQDWRGDISQSEIEKRILKRTHGGDIICLHDGRGKNEAPSRTIEALKNVIPKLLEKGYVFEVLSNYEK